METKGKTMANDEADYKPVSEPGGSQSKRFLDVGVKASLQFEMSFGFSQKTSLCHSLIQKLLTKPTIG